VSLFGTHLFANDALGQVTLPEPASDALISELRVTGGRLPSRTVEPSSTPDVPKETGDKMLSGGGLPTWAPYAMVGGGIIFAGLMIWSSMRRPTPNRRRRHRRSR
jgi:hypothetical protein